MIHCLEIIYKKTKIYMTKQLRNIREGGLHLKE